MQVRKLSSYLASSRKKMPTASCNKQHNHLMHAHQNFVKPLPSSGFGHGVFSATVVPRRLRRQTRDESDIADVPCYPKTWSLLSPLVTFELLKVCLATPTTYVETTGGTASSNCQVFYHYHCLDTESPSRLGFRSFTFRDVPTESTPQRIARTLPG